MKQWFWTCCGTVLALLLLSVPARALDCTSVVADEAGVLQHADIDNLATLAGQLNALGADPKVRVFKDTGSFGSLDGFVKTFMVSQCPSWANRDASDLKDNLVVVAISMDKRVAVYAGGQFTNALPSAVVNVISGRDMVAFLKMKPPQIAGALAAGINGAAQHMRAGVATPPVQAGPVDLPPPVSMPERAPSPPVDLTWLWWTLGGLALLVAGWAIISNVLASRREKRRAAEQLANARDEAKRQKLACAERTSSVELARKLVLSKISTASSVLTADEQQAFQKRYDGLATEIAGFLAEYAQITDPAKATSVSACANAGTYYASLTGSLREVEERCAAFEEELQALVARAAEIPKEIAAMLAPETGALALAEAALQRAVTAGFDVKVLADRVTAARATLDDAQSAATEKRFAEAAEKASEAKEATVGVMTTVAALAATRDAIPEGIASMRAEIGVAQNALQKAIGMCQTLCRRYGAAACASVGGVGSAVRQLTEQAAAEATRAEGGVGSNSAAKILDADDAVQDGTEYLRQAKKLLAEVVALKETLTQREHEVKTLVVQAEAHVDALATYEQTYDADIDDAVKEDIATARAGVKTLDAALTRDTLDVEAIATKARAISATVDRVLASARSEHETAERLRQDAANARNAAEHALLLATQFVKLHGSDVGKEVRDALGAAKEALNAPAEGTLDAQRSHCETVCAAIKKAHEAAEEQVRQAVAARTPKPKPRPRQTPRSYGNGGVPRPRQDSDDDVLGAFMGALVGASIANSLESSSRRSSGSSRRHSSSSGSDTSWSAPSISLPSFGGGTKSSGNDTGW